MTKKLELKEILAAIDLNGKEVWDEWSDEERKSVSLFTLNRFVSSVRGSRELQEHYLLLGNERYNKNLFSIMSRHPKLAWQLACSCSHESHKIMHHEWIKIEKNKNKKEEWLSEQFPNMKMSDIETLAAIIDDKDIKEYAKDLGWDKKQVADIKL